MNKLSPVYENNKVPEVCAEAMKSASTNVWIEIRWNRIVRRIIIRALSKTFMTPEIKA